ncbi:unnamed protein product [Strongylus vulgaris]|uniref:Uncharacterized protein n=1 Tax=Strongylus vulgaris TaxID=40348 RepID=A0A3P7JN32_STRVU|nr:unnamed protein product [Strongylus vulgaris]
MKHKFLPDYRYKIELRAAKENTPRTFLVSPFDPTSHEVDKYIKEILERSRKNVDLEAAAAIVNGADQLRSPPCKKSRSDGVFSEINNTDGFVTEISLGPTTSSEVSASDTPTSRISQSSSFCINSSSASVYPENMDRDYYQPAATGFNYQMQQQFLK